jgi:hypothetical protein
MKSTLLAPVKGVEHLSAEHLQHMRNVIRPLRDWPALHQHPAAIKAKGYNEKYSYNLWLVIQKWLTSCPTTASLRDMRDSLPANDKRKSVLLDLMRRTKASRFDELRILLVADSELTGLENDLSMGSLWLAARDTISMSDTGVLRFYGARANKLGSSALMHRDFNSSYVDVTDTFWRLYQQYGTCFLLGMKMSNHRWQYITSSSRRCQCCGLWSYAGKNRTVVTLQQREITQVREWEHGLPRALSRYGLRDMTLAHVYRREIEATVEQREYVAAAG